MKIRSKTLLMLGIAFIILFVSLIGATEQIMGNSYDKLEKQEISDNIQRANTALNTEILFLEAVDSDWAPWDDTYYFMLGEYDGYIDSNLDAETLVNMGANMVLYYDASNQLYYSMGADFDSYEEMEISPTLTDHIASKEALFSHPDGYSTLSGIIDSPEGTLLIASCPITRNSREKPIAGTLIMARYLDQALIEELEEKTLLDLDIKKIEQSDAVPQKDSSVMLASGTGEISIDYLSDSSVLGTTVLKDINGEPILTLSAEIPRSIHQQGEETKQYLFIVFLLLGFVYGLIVTLSLERSVLKPLSLLNVKLAYITESGSLSSRLQMKGDDELHGLANNINYMLGSLEEKGTIIKTLDILESSLNSMDTGIMIVDMNSRVIMNSKFIDMWDLNTDMLEQNDVTRILEYIASSSRNDNGNTETIEYLQNNSSVDKIHLNLKNGLTYEWHVGPLLHNQSSIGAVYCANNITDRVRVQQMEQEHKERIDAILKNIISGVLVIDKQTHEIVDSNPVAESMIGLPKEKIIGNQCHQFVYTAEKGNCPITDKGLVVDKSERVLINGAGKKIPILKSAVSANLSGKEYLIESFVDMTKIKEAEQGLIEAKVAAESSNRAKSDFLATMSHELRTPLNSIIGFSDLIIGGSVGDISDMQKKFLGNISTSGNHLLSLINNVLDISKIEAGKMVLDYEVFKVEETITEVSQLIAPLADQKKHNVKFHRDQKLKYIHADKIRFKQILFNLVSNAIKFTPDGGMIDISANMLGNKACFTVKDNGIGIDEENQSKLFQPFTQIDSATNRHYEGTGLGLSLVKRFLELHKGNIWFESAPGKGTTFTFELPLEKNINPDDAEEMEMEPINDNNESVQTIPHIIEPENSTGNEPLILVVEDDDDSRELLEFTLAYEGYRVASVASGKEALELANSMKPFAITLDIMMPKMDGWEVLKHLRDEERTHDIPVIITSMTDDKEMGIVWGAVDYFTKPVEKKIMLATLDKLKENDPKSPLKVLVVDDEKDAVDLITEMLEGEDFEVLPAYGGQDAIDFALKENPDVIVLDLTMPEVTGFDVIQALKNRKETIDIPIIICTSMGIENYEAQDTVSGVLQKGMFSKENLIESIRNSNR
ncbi:response regulator [Methanolobus sp. ZRKC3]|uniref:response regulator n=1 Tax=Methanolobus sp. ZRKC3 TaxID=3125786 RepID=UPI003255D25B